MQVVVNSLHFKFVICNFRETLNPAIFMISFKKWGGL